MLAVILQIFEHAFMGLCLTSLSLVFFSLAGLLRLLPQILRFTRWCLRGLFILSFRLYRLILTRLGLVHPQLDIDLLSGTPRVIACLLLSLLIGLVILILAGLPIRGWIVAILLLHGLVVGLAWDEIVEPEGLQLGVKIQ